MKRDSNEFGDFANAFGNAPAAPLASIQSIPHMPSISPMSIPSIPTVPIPPVGPAPTNAQNNNDGFADFTSAFSGGASANDIMTTSGWFNFYELYI